MALRNFIQLWNLSDALPLKCCNIEGGCHTTTEALLNGLTYDTFLGLILGILTGFLFMVIIIKCTIYNKYCKKPMDDKNLREKILSEKNEAFETIGHESIYGFFLTKNKFGWIIALSVITFQFWVFLYFVWAAEKGRWYYVSISLYPSPYYSLICRLFSAANQIFQTTRVTSPIVGDARVTQKNAIFLQIRHL